MGPTSCIGFDEVAGGCFGLVKEEEELTNLTGTREDGYAMMMMMILGR